MYKYAEAAAHYTSEHDTYGDSADYAVMEVER